MQANGTFFSAEGDNAAVFVEKSERNPASRAHARIPIVNIFLREVAPNARNMLAVNVLIKIYPAPDPAPEGAPRCRIEELKKLKS